MNKDIIMEEERIAWVYCLNDFRHFVKDLDISLEEIDDLVHHEDCLQDYENKIIVKG